MPVAQIFFLCYWSSHLLVLHIPADPFLPKKIEEGRLEDIRECIGCNICVSGDWTQSPIRCTQNPTMGEEWRRGWHPEKIPACKTKDSVLVIGAGPAGLECARALGQRGFLVTIAEASDELGGRVNIESQLPGLASWVRVRDYRTHLLQRMENVDIYRGNMVKADDVLDFGCQYAVIATGANWVPDILGEDGYPCEIDGMTILTPDDVLAGVTLEAPVVIYDFDHYYMGGCLAELLRKRGLEVTIATNANAVSAWTFMNNELAEIRSRMLELGVRTILENRLTGYNKDQIELTSIYRDQRKTSIDCGSLVVVGARKTNDTLFSELNSDQDRLQESGIQAIRAIGDCRSPGAIVHAIYSGHECARTIDTDDGLGPIAWERPDLR